MFGRRRRGEEESIDRTSDSGPEPAEPAAASHDKTDRTDGPYDESEVDLDEAKSGRIDLGGLLVKPTAGMKLQIKVDKRTGKGSNVVLNFGESAVQLVAVAAPRSSGMWEQTRLQIAEDAKGRGGRADEGSGPFGTEMRIVVPVQSSEGQQGRQPSRVSGIDGPRWMLRATFLGTATSDRAVFLQLVDIVRQTVVVRGSGPMAPGEVITVTPPAGEETGEGPTEPLQA